MSRPEWRSVFDSAGLSGTFVVRRLGTAEFQAYDTTRARKGFIPASTFKIPNSLIPLELKVVADENERFVYDWPRSTISEDWNRDHTFRTALKYSVLPIYQAIARKVGEPAYRDWLTRLEYGNRNPGGESTASGSTARCGSAPWSRSSS